MTRTSIVCGVVTAVALVVLAASGSAAFAFTDAIPPGQARTLPFASCLNFGVQWLARIRPSNCDVVQVASGDNILPPAAELFQLRKILWTSWTKTRAVGSAVNPASTDANMTVRVPVIFDLPKLGCPPDHEGHPGMRTFSRARVGSTIVRMDVMPCLPPGA